ncbi:DUF3226 domain-containing protein [Planktothrix sp. FACHB-1365]|uniref:DUF3226 domain-containing protein n=1 Tax=Planktothrix sp. FACHB-1365 TaxID=2692855 RepID=UPI001687BA0E|nr:DUF3226 domain-containing protein [Planktothrix sp. FACHB-1365]MBD2483505.1 hypothetical protein [Planktothrix sp. FACHB-1365]
MTKNSRSNNVLLVEGKEDVRVIPELIEANGIAWGTKKNPVVYIQENNGYDNLIKPDVISTELKASGLSALGIMIDADDDPRGRWQSLRNTCLSSIPDLPEKLPETGLIHLTSNQVRFGVWMMPDNQMQGMLENFIAYMIPDESELIWQFAQNITIEAKQKGALFKETHQDKANIYTWLAWQNPPGRQLHQAINQKILNPKHPKAQKFVNWFKILYNLS